MPQLSNEHPDAICPRLTINDLFIFRDVYEGMRAGKGLESIGREIGVSRKKCYLVLKAVAQGLIGPGAKWSTLRLKPSRSENEKDESPAGRFYDGLDAVLQKLKELVIAGRAAQARRVVIEGTETCLRWLLPQVLKGSGFLDKTRAVLEIKRAPAERFIPHVQNGRADLALGSDLTLPSDIHQELLLTVPRSLIYPKKHTFRCGKAPAEVALADLSHETVFVLTPKAFQQFRFDHHLSPKGQGRKVYVDAISHMYQYVAQGLGVAVAYPPWFVGNEGKPVESCELVDEKAFPAANFYLYSAKGRALSEPAARLKQAICDEARKVKPQGPN
jgi:DNA-binding transcriptional LysR family regulator